MKKQGTVYTFYSFKGGVGRSMALANAACVLAKQGYRVLIIDWDLEAPGIEKYFTQYIQPSARELYGIVDLVDAWAHNETISWESNLLYATPFPNGESVAILTAGKSSANYIGKLQQINWPNLFQEKKFGNYLEQLRTEWVENFDFVLVDSRTGITDIGGICTIHLPDTLVMFFSANEQSLAGVLDVMNRIWESHKALPLDRSKLLCLPVPGRFENFTEYKLATKWKNIFAERLAPLYKDWLPDNTTPHQILEKLFIPYIPYWSFGEGLPVVEEGSTDPRTLGFAYDLLARLLANRLQWNDSLSPEISITHELSGPRLNEWAEAFYNKYDDHEKEIVKNIFLKLINVTTNSKLSLTAAHFNEMERSLLDRLLAEAVLQKRANSLTKETLFEISSESLITSWEWIFHSN